MIKYSVGFQLYDNGEEPFSEIVRSYVEHISEVFFAWQDISTGRSAIATRHGYTDWSAQARTEEELRRIKGLGVRLDLLFNGNCYGEYAISEKLANTVISVVEYLEYIGCGVDIITTASPAIAHTVKKHFPQNRGARIGQYADRYGEGNGVRIRSFRLLPRAKGI